MAVDVSADKASCERLVSVHRWTDKLMTFRTTRPAGYQFVAGQFARLGLEIEGEIVWRAYSVTSAENDSELEYYAIVVPEGLFTSKLDQLEPGAPVWVEKLSYGFMTPDRFVDGKHLWMLATGTGLGPFISILLQQDVWHKFEDLVLVHCVRHADEWSYSEQLAALQVQARAAGLTARLHLLQLLTREPAAPGKLQGRITDLLRNGSLEAATGLALDVDNARVMACGNPDMVTEVREILKERGMTPLRRNGGGQFVTEDYW